MKKNKIDLGLTILFIFAMFFSLKLSPSVFILKNEFIRSIFSIDSSSIEKYSYIYNLCLAFCANYIFYFTAEILPKYNAKRIAKSKIREDLNYLLTNLDLLIFASLNLFNIQVELSKLREINLLPMNIISMGLHYDVKTHTIILTKFKELNKQIAVGTYRIDKNNKKVLFLRGYETHEGMISNSISFIKESLDKIKKYERFIFVDEDFSELISQLETSKFFEQNTNNDNYFRMIGSTLLFFEIVQIYLNLLKLKLHTKRFTCGQIDDFESITLDQHNDRVKQNNALKREVNPTIIFDRSSHIMEGIADMLEKTLRVKALDIKEFNPSTLNNSKALIVIYNGKTKKYFYKFNNIIEDKTLKIFLVREHIFPVFKFIELSFFRNLKSADIQLHNYKKESVLWKLINYNKPSIEELQVICNKISNEIGK